MRIFINADGSCEPNPGPSACGIVVQDESGAVLESYTTALGEGTSNTAEWSALIAALRYAERVAAVQHVTVRMDSRLVVEQSNGRWKIKAKNLRAYAETAAGLRRSLAARGCAVRVEWVSRENNSLADAVSR